MYTWGRQIDLAALRKAANANLARLASGEAARELAQVSARNKAARVANAARAAVVRSEKVRLVKTLATVRKQLAEIEPEWDRLMALHTADTISRDDYAALEEYDSLRDQYMESIGEVLDEAARLGLMLR